jgi:hypothetical protein
MTDHTEQLLVPRTSRSGRNHCATYCTSTALYYPGTINSAVIVTAHCTVLSVQRCTVAGTVPAPVLMY